MKVIKIPELPAGRYKANCDPPSSSGEAFRDDVLIPALKEHGSIIVDITPKYGVPVSWSEEVFGGLVRKLGATVIDRIRIESLDHKDDVQEAVNFMQEQADRDTT